MGLFLLTYLARKLVVTFDTLVYFLVSHPNQPPACRSRIFEMSGDAKPSLINPKSSSIPTRIVEIKDASQMPTDFSTTPGGTLFSTTPGGKLVVLSDSHC